jgi:hypothetical protein
LFAVNNIEKMVKNKYEWESIAGSDQIRVRPLGSQHQKKKTAEMSFSSFGVAPIFTMSFIFIYRNEGYRSQLLRGRSFRTGKNLRTFPTCLGGQRPDESRSPIDRAEELGWPCMQASLLL